jgi:MFS family permease
MTAKPPDHRHNYLFNLFDGSAFGFALGFASFITIMPLFVSQMTNLQILVGLVPSIRGVGWQLPQLFMARLVARQRRLKPLVLTLTLFERLPFLGLALVAWNYERLGNTLALALTFALLIMSGLGSGVTANAWQSMIAKLFAPNQRGGFLGWQAGLANLLLSISAVFAGRILADNAFPFNFFTCFLLATAWFAVSWVFLAFVREPDGTVVAHASQPPLWQSARRILGEDANFRRLLLARNLSQFAAMPLSFYAVYAVRRLGLSPAEVGVLTGAFASIQLFANPLLGLASDRFGARSMLLLGMVCMGGSTLAAAYGQSLGWFYAAYALAGIAMVSVWTIGMVLTLQFGQEDDRPAYIGLANTLTAPSTILAPLVGGLLIDLFNYQVMFVTALVCTLLSLWALLVLREQPRQQHAAQTD